MMITSCLWDENAEAPCPFFVVAQHRPVYTHCEKLFLASTPVFLVLLLSLTESTNSPNSSRPTTGGLTWKWKLIATPSTKFEFQDVLHFTSEPTPHISHLTHAAVLGATHASFTPHTRHI